MQSSLPKISCLLVTAVGRQDFFARSLKCYVDQTYPNRELLVVNEGPQAYQKELEKLIDATGDSSIRTAWLRGKYSLGSLRNISIGLSEGEIVCQWDDDDFCMPTRLAVQYNYLDRHLGCRICYLSDQLHYYFPTRQLYWDNWWRYHSGKVKRYGLIPGSLMAYRDYIPVRYPSLPAGEDSVFSERLLIHDESKVVLAGNMGFIHVYSYHGTNQVYGIDHHIGISKKRSQPYDVVMDYKKQICDTIDYMQFEGLTRVMCRDGLVFTYEAQ